MISRYFLGLSALLLSLGSSTAQDLDIHLHTGTFRGSLTPDGDVEKWLGIPFAEPPVGELRFKAPVAINKRSSALKNATTFGNACPQQPGNLGAPISEDCLFLNVCKKIISPVSSLTSFLRRCGALQAIRMRNYLSCSGFM